MGSYIQIPCVVFFFKLSNMKPLALWKLSRCVSRRPSVSRDGGTLRPRTQLLLLLGLSLVGGASCGALAILAAFLLHLYRVSRGEGWVSVNERL